ncbi:alpha/beta family hydrolase [Raineyella fluvialis]|uniref:alpha/beta hydrolase family protein n=1 Tax=Raineyella fluvialis TaxID=2662261 RepID=UPI001E2AF3FE|nr:alpha/beta family hydrolase [Raineyella fluvialis]
MLRFEQPWRTAGRRVAGPAKQLDSAWQSALKTITDRWPDIPLVVGGRSAGARVACRCFASPARGVVALAFPLHPPGRPASSRAAELDAVEGPVLIVQGERDPFGTSDEVRRAFPGRDVVNVAGAVHGLGPTRKADDPTARAAAIVEPVARFVSAVTGGGQLPRTSARS